MDADYSWESRFSAPSGGTWAIYVSGSLENPLKRVRVGSTQEEQMASAMVVQLQKSRGGTPIADLKSIVKQVRQEWGKDDSKPPTQALSDQLVNQSENGKQV